ncbi:uncharacterized protein BDZ99DRAFT_546507, partial [Mytilinidion resinicola]
YLFPLHSSHSRPCSRIRAASDPLIAFFLSDRVTSGVSVAVAVACVNLLAPPVSAIFGIIIAVGRAAGGSRSTLGSGSGSGSDSGWGGVGVFPGGFKVRDLALDKSATREDTSRVRVTTWSSPGAGPWVVTVAMKGNSRSRPGQTGQKGQTTGVWLGAGAVMVVVMVVVMAGQVGMAACAGRTAGPGEARERAVRGGMVVWSFVDTFLIVSYLKEEGEGRVVREESV